MAKEAPVLIANDDETVQGTGATGIEIAAVRGKTLQSSKRLSADRRLLAGAAGTTTEKIGTGTGTVTAEIGITTGTEAAETKRGVSAGKRPGRGVVRLPEDDLSDVAYERAL